MATQHIDHHQCLRRHPCRDRLRDRLRVTRPAGPQRRRPRRVHRVLLHPVRHRARQASSRLRQLRRRPAAAEAGPHREPRPGRHPQPPRRRGRRRRHRRRRADPPGRGRARLRRRARHHLLLRQAGQVLGPGRTQRGAAGRSTPSWPTAPPPEDPPRAAIATAGTLPRSLGQEPKHWSPLAAAAATSERTHVGMKERVLPFEAVGQHGRGDLIQVGAPARARRAARRHRLLRAGPRHPVARPAGCALRPAPFDLRPSTCASSATSRCTSRRPSARRSMPPSSAALGARSGVAGPPRGCL